MAFADQSLEVYVGRMEAAMTLRRLPFDGSYTTFSEPFYDDY